MASARGKSSSQGPFCCSRSPPQRNLGFEGWSGPTREKTASVQLTANVAAAVKTTAGNAVAAPEGGCGEPDVNR